MTSYIVNTILLVVLSYVYIRIADRFNIIDKPNHRSSHTKSTIRGGGILFFLALLLFFVQSDFQYSYFVIGVSIIAIVSFVDDMYTLSSKVRLPFQLIALILLVFQLFPDIQAWWIILGFSIVGIGFINIYNFMDGVNGITGLYSLSVLASYYIINYNEQIVNSDLIIFSAISLLVFGYYNFRKKARFFAGDIGSISIAMILFFIGLKMTLALEAPILLTCFMLYGADALTTMVYRKYLREKLTEAHRHHIYQKLVDVLKWSHLKVSIVYTLVQLLLNLVVFYTYEMDMITQWYIYFGLITLFILLYVALFRRIERVKTRSLK